MTPETLAWEIEGHGGGCDSHVWDHGRAVISSLPEYCNILKFWSFTSLCYTSHVVYGLEISLVWRNVARNGWQA